MRKIIFRILGVLFLVLLLLAVAIPYFFKDDLITAFKSEMADYVDADVNFSDVSFGILEDFPNVSLTLEDLSVNGKGDFIDETLYKADETSVSINIASLLNKNKPYEINKIILDRPRIKVIKLPSGNTNYAIIKSQETQSSESSASYVIALDEFKINAGDVYYEDRQSGLSSSIRDFDHTSTGKFTEDVFDLKSNNSIGNLTTSSKGVNLISDWTIDGLVNINVNLPQNIYTFDNNVLKINDLDIDYSGDIKIAEDNYKVNLDFNAPNNELKSLLSLIPGVYKHDFKDLKATGNSNLKGTMAGVYSDNSFPAFELEGSVQNGKMSYPDLPEEISAINTEFKLASNDAKMQSLLLDIPRLTMQMGKHPIDGRCKVVNLLTNPDVDAVLNGNLDLAYLNKFVNIEGLRAMEGKADTRILLKANYDDVNTSRYDQVVFNADIRGSDIKIDYDDYPTFEAESLAIEGSQQQLRIQNTAVKLGQSDASIGYTMSNPVGFIIANKPSQANLTLRSKTINVNELITTNHESSDLEEEADVGSDVGFENLTLDYDIEVADLQYEDYKIKELAFKGRYNDDNADITVLNLDYEDTPVSVNGRLENVTAYNAGTRPLTGKITVNAQNIDANKFLGESTSSSNEAEPGVIAVPENMDLTIQSDIRQLQYEDYDLKNVKGAIVVKDEIARLVGFNANTMGGNITLDGDYNTQDIQNPTYKLSYDMDDMDFTTVFEKSISVKKLAPILEFVDGSFNSNSSFEGKVGEDMMPDLSTLTADGFLETLNSVILNVPVLDELGNTLGIKELKRYEIKDSKNWFTIENGAVTVEEFDFSKDDMNFTMGGFHHIDQSINYKIKAEIPRNKLEQSNVTGVVNSGLNWLNKQTASKGINLSVGDYVFLDINITGTIKNPKIKIVPTGSGGKNLKDEVKDQVVDQVEAVKEEYMTKAEKEIERRKQEAEKRANAEVTKVKDKVQEKIDQEVEKGKEAIKEKAKEVVKEQVVDTLTNVVKEKVGDKVEEVIGDKAKEEVDKVKDKLKDINPFKKKKD